jgi:hypothetical protein
MSKTAIVILSDPKNCTEESLGRAFNALAAAFDFKTAGKEVTILFQGAGSRWPEQLKKEDHLLHALYKAVEDKIEGISSGCANAFSAETSGFDLVKDNQVPGTSGLPSLVRLTTNGFNILTF